MLGFVLTVAAAGDDKQVVRDTLDNIDPLLEGRGTPIIDPPNTWYPSYVWVGTEIPAIILVGLDLAAPVNVQNELNKSTSAYYHVLFGATPPPTRAYMEWACRRFIWSYGATGIWTARPGDSLVVTSTPDLLSRFLPYDGTEPRP